MRPCELTTALPQGADWGDKPAGLSPPPSPEAPSRQRLGHRVHMQNLGICPPRKSLETLSVAGPGVPFYLEGFVIFPLMGEIQNISTTFLPG